MSSKICETIQNTINPAQVGAFQDLDLSLKTKINSEQEPVKEPLQPSILVNTSSNSESGPLSERHLSNFDNQTNVKISNQKSNCSNEQASNQKPSEDSEKASSDGAIIKTLNSVPDSLAQESSPQEENQQQKTEMKNNSKIIQKPQQKRKMEKSKNKLIDKENISTESATENAQSNQLPLAIKEDKPLEAIQSSEDSESTKVAETKPVLEIKQSDSDYQSQMSTKPSNESSSEDSFQQTLSTESMKAETTSEISRLEEQIMAALEQLKQNQANQNPKNKVQPEKLPSQPKQKLIEEVATANQPADSNQTQEQNQKNEQEIPFTMNDMPTEEQLKDINQKDILEKSSDSNDQKEQVNENPTMSSAVVDKAASANLDEQLATKISNNQISELTESIVDDLIKNAFRPEPVNIEKDQDTEEVQKREEKLTLEQEYLDMGDEEDNLNIRETFKDQELSKEDAVHIKSPVKSRPEDKNSSDGDQSQEEEEYMELGYQNINNVLYVDTKVMNFGTFMPGGKLLGSNLMIQNITKCEQIIELSVDSSSFRYKINDLTTLFPTIQNNRKRSPTKQEGTKDEKSKQAVLPFEIENLKQSDNQSKSNFIKNSEYIHEAWFIENPVSRELTKRITLKLGPMAQQDFIIVNRSPIQIKRTENMLSIINVGLLTYKGEQFGVKHSFENFLKYQYNNDMKLFLADRKELSQIQRMKVLLAGKVQVPKITCIKEIFLEDHGLRVMPLAVKKGFQQQIQRFKIPFKNTTSMDMEVEFQFMKTSAVINPASDQLPGATNSPEESKIPVIKKGNMMQSLMASPLELAAQPQTMKIGGNQQVILNISARLKNSYLLQQKELDASTTLTEKQKQKTLKAMAKERFHHLLVARVKDTNMMFSYLFQVQLLQQEAQVQVSQQVRQMAANTKAD